MKSYGSAAPAPMPLPSVNKDAKVTPNGHVGAHLLSRTIGNAVMHASAPSTTAAGAPLVPPALPTHVSMATTHMNAAVFHGVTYPTSRAAAIARDAAEAAQLYYNLFFEVNGEEDALSARGNSLAITAVGRESRELHEDASLHQHRHSRQLTREHSSTTGAPTTSTGVLVAVAHDDFYRPIQGSNGGGGQPLDGNQGGGAVSSTSFVNTSTNNVLTIDNQPQQQQLQRLYTTAARDPLRSQVSHHGSSNAMHRCDKSNHHHHRPTPTSRRSSHHGYNSKRGSSDTDGDERGPYSCSGSYEASVTNRSIDTYSCAVHTPINVVNTSYHTFFPPVLSRSAREAIVQRIVGHRPRAYRKWPWRKAEDYHALHALNVHNNNVYHPEVALGGGPGTDGILLGTAGAAPAAQLLTVSPASQLGLHGAAPVAMGDSTVDEGKVEVETPLSTSPSYPTSSPVCRAAGALGVGGKAVHGGLEDSSSANKESPQALPVSGAPRGLPRVPTSVGLAVEEEEQTRIPSIATFTANDMPFELMSQLSMYTIPASQQGPEYFKAAAEDGTKTLIIFMMGLPARGKTFLAQKICRLLGWHGSRAKVQNIQVAWRRVLLDWEATRLDTVPPVEHEEIDDDPAAAAATTTAAGGVPDTSACSEVEAQNTVDATMPVGSASQQLRGCRLARQRSPYPPAGVPLVSATGSPVAPSSRSTFTRVADLSDSCAAQDEVTRLVRRLATESLCSPVCNTEAASLCGSSDSETSASNSARTTPTAAGVSRSTSTQSGTGTTAACGRPCAADTSVSTMPADQETVAAPPSLPLNADVSAARGAYPVPEPGDGARGSPCRSTEGGSPNTTAMDSLSNGGVASVEAHAGTRPHGTASATTDDPTIQDDVLRTRHFRDLITDPTSAARRIYRLVLQSFADDCRLFFQHGGEVVVVNDDFVTEEMRQEAERYFRPLAAQFFYMEVIRDAAADPLNFVRCKIRDPVEYPRNAIELSSAEADFHERLAFLESVYETLEDAPKAPKRGPAHPTASAPFPGTAEEVAETHPQTSSQPFRPQQFPTRSYVKIRNSSTIETHGISGFLASRIISYVMNLSQDKIQHPIYFVRHGESCYNLEDRIGGNPLLTEQGMRDAGALLEFLASLKHHLEHQDRIRRSRDRFQQHQQQHRTASAAAPHLHRTSEYTTPITPVPSASPLAAESNTNASTANQLEMWTSQLRRAIQTAELSERLLNIRTLRWSSLNEIHAGVCEDMTYAEVKERYPLIDYFRKRSKYTFRYPEGESYQDLVVRLEPVIMELENADKVVVVVAHQAVLRCLLAYFGSTSAESSISVEVPHRTVWRCTYDSKGIASLDELRLDNYEAGFHLPPRRTEGSTPSTVAPPTFSG